MKQFFTLILFLINITIIYCQDVDSNTLKEYKEYRKVFDTELKKLTDPETKSLPKYKVLLPESTPLELLHLPVSDENKMFSIGVSDPGMDEKEGYEQALVRAKSILAFYKNFSIKHISEDYTEEYSNSRINQIAHIYADFYSINTILALDTNDIIILTDTINRFGETLLLLEYNPGSSNTNQIVNCDLLCMIKEIRHGSSFEIEQRTDIFCDQLTDKIHTKKYSFISRKLKKQFDINSSFNGKEITPPLYTLRYKNTIEISDSIADTKIQSLLSDGLWNGIIDCLIQNLFVESKLRSSVLKSTSDTHSQKHQNINREIASSIASIRLDNIYIYNNRIHVDITIL